MGYVPLMCCPRKYLAGWAQCRRLALACLVLQRRIIHHFLLQPVAAKAARHPRSLALPRAPSRRPRPADALCKTVLSEDVSTRLPLLRQDGFVGIQAPVS